MKKGIITGLLMSCSLLTGCALVHPYQPNIQQGNVITPKMRSQLHEGMSKDQVSGILGEPVLSNTFNDNHWAYIHTFQHNGRKITQKRLDLYFQNDRLVRIVGDYS